MMKSKSDSWAEGMVNMGGGGQEISPGNPTLGSEEVFEDSFRLGSVESFK
jgi:hypothetical protein